MQEKHLKLAPASGNPIEPEMNPGEELPPPSATVGENVCPQCNGSGIRDDDGMRCEHCGGTGKISEGPIHP